METSRSILIALALRSGTNTSVGTQLEEANFASSMRSMIRWSSFGLSQFGIGGTSIDPDERGNVTTT